MPHVGVMKEEISSLLKDVPEGYFIDATYGDGSHFEFIDSEKKFTTIGFDRDFDSVAGKKNNHNVVQLNFSKIHDYLEKNSFSDDGKNEIDDFEFNQDFEIDDNEVQRSPGWIRYQKRIK